MSFLLTLQPCRVLSLDFCRFSFTASSGKAETVLGGFAWRTSRRPFPHTQRAASERGWSSVLISNVQVLQSRPTCIPALQRDAKHWNTVRTVGIWYLQDAAMYLICVFFRDGLQLVGFKARFQIANRGRDQSNGIPRAVLCLLQHDCSWAAAEGKRSLLALRQVTDK